MPSPSWNASRGGGGGVGWGVKTHEEGRKGTLAIELLFFFLSSLLLLLGRHEGLSQNCKFVIYSKFLCWRQVS